MSRQFDVVTFVVVVVVVVVVVTQTLALRFENT